MEGQFDVITAHHFGVTNAVASSGTALTEDQVRLLKRFTDELLLVFDADRAGRSAARKAAVLVAANGMRTRVASIPDGLDPDEMRRLGREALNEVTLRRIYPEGMRRIREHKRAGHRVLLLTGALDVVVEPLAELLDVEVDCAHLLIKDGRMTGDLAAPPPAGEARGALLEEYATRNGVVLADSFAYADSLSDLPMLELVGTPVAVNPDARLSQVAGQRGWRVERWRMAPGNWRLPMPDPRSPEYLEAVRR